MAESVGAPSALLSARFKHISFELSAKIRFLAARRPSKAPRDQHMSSFELNKIAGAVLGAMLLAMLSGVIAGLVVHPTPLAQPAYMVAAAPAAAPPAAEAAKAPAAPAAKAPTAAATAAPTAAAPPPAAATAGGQPAATAPAAGAQTAEGGAEPIGPLLAAASVDDGKNRARICNACHTFDKGGPNRIGPNLWDTVGEPIAEGHDGYSFSAALQGHKGEKWTVDELSKWLTKPADFARGTKMTFAGFPNAKDRADVIAYLNSLSDSPKPLK
jgi:cytochrome c